MHSFLRVIILLFVDIYVEMFAEKPVEPVKPLKSDPSFPITLDDVTVKEGEDIFLHCQVLGNPRPTVGEILVKSRFLKLSKFAFMSWYHKY